MASAAVNQMWIFETAVNVKMVTMIYRILISMAVNVSKAFHRVTKKEIIKVLINYPRLLQLKMPLV